ncbi:MAG: hypothetical protein ACRETP_02930 [Steroidobacteraceae bacterium]
MRPLPRQKLSAFRERQERLRKARDASQTLRSAFPNATLVNVNLQFLPATAPPHAAQSFVLYPGARAFFTYPCPYGDCDGVYELAAAAEQARLRKNSPVSGTVECGGVRSRDGLPRQPCGLRMSYTITAQHEPPRATSAEANVARRVDAPEGPR